MEDPPRGQPEDRQVKEPGRASASRPSEAGTLRTSSGGRGSEWRSGKPQIDLVPPPRTRPDTGPPKSGGMEGHGEVTGSPSRERSLQGGQPGHTPARRSRPHREAPTVKGEAPAER